MSGAYFNRLFLGFSSKLELMQHYTIIITVLAGLEHFKNFGTGVGYVSNGFGLMDDGQKHAAIS